MKKIWLWYVTGLAIVVILLALSRFFDPQRSEPMASVITGLLLVFSIAGIAPTMALWAITNRKSIPMKRILTAALIVFLIIFTAINYITYSRVGVFIWDLVGSGPLSNEEIQEIAQDLTRGYPEVIKGSWEPNAFHMERMMMRDSDRLKGMGVNTVSVSVDYEFNKDGTYFMRDEERAISNLVRAKERGFAVQVAVNFVGPYGHDFKKGGVQITKEQYLNISSELALKWAEIAERYKAEFFCPQSEIDFIVHTNFAGEGSQRERNVEKAKIVADWHEQILPKVKEVFKGKVLVEFSWAEWENVDAAEQYMGYDYIGTGISHNTQDLEDFRVMVGGQYSKIAALAKKSNSSWFVKEAWFPFGGPFYPSTTNVKGESLDALQDDYYKISIEEYLNVTDPKPAGYIFHSWTMPSSPIKDRPAENVLKEFYNK